MPRRFVFRQVQAADIRTFVRDGEVRARLHPAKQRCHSASYETIVNRRGEPDGLSVLGVPVNGYVPFYFSPRTSYAHAVNVGGVDLVSPEGRVLGKTSWQDRAFLVARPKAFARAGLDFAFTDVALNSRSRIARIETDLAKLETHVNWPLFDEAPISSEVREIGYAGVCRYFHDRDVVDRHRNRKAERMAEFLVREAVPLAAFACVIAPTKGVAHTLAASIEGCDLRVFVKPDCFSR